MSDDPSWTPEDGVPEVPGVAYEVDITDEALAAGAASIARTYSDGPSRAYDTARDAAAETRADGVDGDDPRAGTEPPGAGDVDPFGGGPGAAEHVDPLGLGGGADRLAGFGDGDPGAPERRGPLDGTYQDIDTPDLEPAGESGPPLRKVIESILLVVDQPVPEVELAQVLEVPRATVLGALEDLAAEYARDDRGFELRQVAGGWRLYTAPDCAPYVERFVLDGQQARLTQAALETLAVVAYRQPVSRQSISAIRGVNVDGVIRTLLSRGLIAEAGQEGPGGAHLYVTTPYFLERLGLRSLGELPNLAPLLPSSIDDLADGA